MMSKLLYFVELQNYHNLTNGISLLFARIMNSLMRHNDDH